MEALGASRSVVGLVIPTGYSFNLDGTNIYMTLATLFLAQATNTHLTHRPGADHPGGGDADLQGRLRRAPAPASSPSPRRCRSSPTSRSRRWRIIVGIDKFMSECRALTNLIGNGVATIVISRWEGELDRDQLHKALLHPVAVRRRDGADARLTGGSAVRQIARLRLPAGAPTFARNASTVSAPTADAALPQLLRPQVTSGRQLADRLSRP